VNEGTGSMLPVLFFGGLLGAALPVSPLWYLMPPLFIAFLAVLVAGRKAEGHEFLVLCIGELLVAAAGTGFFWSVLPLQCLLLGVMFSEQHLLATARDLLWYGVFTVGACASLALVLVTRNVLASGFIAVGLFLAVHLALAVGEHEQRKVLSGGAP
jgi:hypothetical protein